MDPVELSSGVLGNMTHERRPMYTSSYVLHQHRTCTGVMYQVWYLRPYLDRGIWLDDVEIVFEDADEDIAIAELEKRAYNLRLAQEE